MAGNFNSAAILALLAAVKTVPAKIGAVRSSTVFHEPRVPPTALPALALWLGPLEPIGAMSGLSEVSGRVTVQGRIFVCDAQKVSDATEVQLLTLMSAVLGGFAGAFTLGGGDVMCVDLLGAYGPKLTATPGYVEYDGGAYRVAEVAVPVIIDPLWTETP